MDKGGLKVVASDLTFLRDAWDQEIDDDSLRRSSPVLRRMLVHGDMLAAWGYAGLSGEPAVSAPSLRQVLASFTLNEISYAQTGGARYEGMQVQSLVVLKRALKDWEVRILAGFGPVPPSELHKITEFVRTPCMIVKGTMIDRGELVRYVANKLGGDHYDEDRTPKKKTQGSLATKFRLLDEVRASMKVAEKNAVYFELLSTGQNLIRSPDVAKLQRKINEVLGTHRV